MKNILRLFLLLPILVVPGWAWSACIGTDMISELRAKDPAGIEKMFARAYEMPNPQGRFWKVEGDGFEPSVLFGTFHASEVVDSVPDQVWNALDRARIAVFELSQEQQAALDERMITDPSFAVDFSAPPLLNDLSEGQVRVLTEALSARGLPVEAANQMRPWLLASLLGFPACHIQSLSQGAQVLDNVLAERAIDNGIKAVGLETYEEALSAFSGFDRAMLIKVLVADNSILQREEDIFHTNAMLYGAGETAVINEFGIWLTEQTQPDYDPRTLNRALMVDLLDKRNRNWMEPLMQHLRGGNAFIGVGALHLPGEVGLIELLRAQGFTVTRLD